ncbi:hypothetical protein C0J52_18884 [Blattella germanica]|nr:hypothetical protein C0J52_18884 [Blattella germanica]
MDSLGCSGLTKAHRVTKCSESLQSGERTDKNIDEEGRRSDAKYLQQVSVEISLICNNYFCN